jgi:hypothetical protein
MRMVTVARMMPRRDPPPPSLLTPNEDGDRGEDDAMTRPLANEDGDGGEDDATTLPEYRVVG